jgi:hypothetical protein
MAQSGAFLNREETRRASCEMTRAAVLAGVGLGILCAAAQVAEAGFCDNLKVAGVEGQYVVVNASSEGERNLTHGNLVKVDSDMLTLELGGVRGFVNCTYIHSVILGKPAEAAAAAPAPTPAPQPSGN